MIVHCDRLDCANLDDKRGCCTKEEIWLHEDFEQELACMHYEQKEDEDGDGD